MKTRNNDQHYEAGKAYQEIVDKLYTLAEHSELTDDWVMETAKSIAGDFRESTNIDLEDF